MYRKLWGINTFKVRLLLTTFRSVWKRASVGFKACIYGCANVSRVSHTPYKISKHSVRWMMEAQLPIPPHTFSGLSNFCILKNGSTRSLAHAFSRTHNEHWLAEGRSPKLILGNLENFKCYQKVRVNMGLVKTFLGRCVQSHGNTAFTQLLYLWRLLYGQLFLASSPLANGHWAHIWSSAKTDDCCRSGTYSHQTSRLISYPLSFTLADLRTVILTFRGYRQSLHRNVRTASQEVQQSLPSTFSSYHYTQIIIALDDT